jgi:hypothetical protein
VDAITHEARYSLSEDRLLREAVAAKTVSEALIFRWLSTFGCTHSDGILIIHVEENNKIFHPLLIHCINDVTAPLAILMCWPMELVSFRCIKVQLMVTRRRVMMVAQSAHLQIPAPDKRSARL